MKKIFLLSQILFFFSITSCASMLQSAFLKEARSGDYELAYSIIEQTPQNYYSKYDEVLQMLDLGMLAYYSEFNSESINYLNQAENLIYKNYTKSISQNISSFILNDNFINYAGEEYEDIYINLFKCLAFIRQENYESAFVEIRRFNNKLKTLSVKYKDKIDEMKMQAKIDSNYLNQDNSSLNFYDSVFARYLSMLLYLYEGDSFSADIDYKYLISAFENQGSLYNFQFPKQVKENFNTPKNKTRLNVVAMSGLAPQKIEKSISNPYYGFKIALPVMQENYSTIKSIKLIVKEKNTNQVFTKDFEKLESVSNIAIETFKQKQNLIYVKSIARSLMKMGTTNLIDDLRAKSADYETQATMDFLYFASLFSNQITEVADVRTSKYFPSNIYISGIDLDPGIYDIVIIYNSSDGDEVYRKTFSNYDVKKSKLNLLEAVCLK